MRSLFDINSNEILFSSFTVSVNKCGGTCNTIDNPYARIYVSNKVKRINLKVFSLMLRVNERRSLVRSK